MTSKEEYCTFTNFMWLPFPCILRSDGPIAKTYLGSPLATYNIDVATYNSFYFFQLSSNDSSHSQMVTYLLTIFKVKPSRQTVEYSVGQSVLIHVTKQKQLMSGNRASYTYIHVLDIIITIIAYISDNHYITLLLFRSFLLHNKDKKSANINPFILRL